MIARTLALRRGAPALFADGSYEPIAVRGEHADRVIAFARRLARRDRDRGGAAHCIAAARARRDPVRVRMRGRTRRSTLDADEAFVDLFSGDEISRQLHKSAIGELFEQMPVSLLIARGHLIRMYAQYCSAQRVKHECELRRRTNHLCKMTARIVSKLTRGGVECRHAANAREPGQSLGGNLPKADNPNAAAMTSRCVGSKTWPAGVATGPRALSASDE